MIAGNLHIEKKQINRTESVVEMQGLYKSFGTHAVLRGVDLSLTAGKNLVIIGRSGSGKSVLAKCIIGLIKADKGHLQVLGTNMFTATPKEVNALKARTGFLFQSNALFDSMDVEHNLTFALLRRNKQISKKETDMLVDEVLDNVGLPTSRKMMPADLSGGMRKRIGLARALILKPELMLYDEPTTGLDPVTSREISQLMVDMQHTYRMSSIIISHDIQCVRITANNIIALIDGMSYAKGTFNELSTHTDPKVNIFFR